MIPKGDLTGRIIFLVMINIMFWRKINLWIFYELKKSNKNIPTNNIIWKRVFPCNRNLWNKFKLTSLGCWKAITSISHEAAKTLHIIVSNELDWRSWVEKEKKNYMKISVMMYSLRRRELMMMYLLVCANTKESIPLRLVTLKSFQINIIIIFFT